MSIQVSYKKQFALGIIFLLIIIVVVEGLARIYEYYRPPNCSILDKDVYQNTDYDLRRQICSDMNQLAYEQSSVLLIKPNQHFKTININSHGFRGPEITKEKPKDIYRIFVVGGSTTFGVGSTSDETTIPGFLQKKFNEANLGVHVEVINAGVPFAYSFSETYYIKNVLLQFEPDLFIIYDGWNDASERNLDEKITEIKGVSNKIDNPFKLSNFPFYRTPFVIYEIFFAKPSSSKTLATNDSTEKLIFLWKTRWAEICNMGKKNGFETLISVQPFVGSGNKVLTKDEYNFLPHTDYDRETIRTLNGFADSLEELKLLCERTVDLRDIFDNISKPAYYDPVHTSDFGNEIVAQKLFDLALPIVLKR